MVTILLVYCFGYSSGRGSSMLLFLFGRVRVYQCIRSPPPTHSHPCSLYLSLSFSPPSIQSIFFPENFVFYRKGSIEIEAASIWSLEPLSKVWKTEMFLSESATSYWYQVPSKYCIYCVICDNCWRSLVGCWAGLGES